MRDIAGWIVEAASGTGRDAELVDDRLPRADGALNLVVAPHEFFELSDAPTGDLQRAAAVSICVCTEQPGTPWFHLSIDACRRGIAALDINPQGVAALRDVGVDARHLRLGATPSIDVASTASGSVADRPIDVLFLGGLDDRRGAVLASLAHGTEQHVERVETPSWATARPDVSVIVTVYNYAGVVTETLESIAASEDVAFEVIVIDDHATDDSRDVVRRFLADHPDVPMVLLGKDANGGLAAARNDGFAEARADLVMVMDADNHVYPTALAKMAAALRNDPGA
ncbi:MAG: glycosyltransferase family 2 protein, partial [Actinomycetes bacterium]